MEVLRCFNKCPYRRQCGTMVTNGADSCAAEIKNIAPGQETVLIPRSLFDVDLQSRNGVLIASVHAGNVHSAAKVA